MAVRAEIDIRVRVGDVAWSPASAEITGDSAGDVAAGISGALRALADEIDAKAMELTPGG